MCPQHISEYRLCCVWQDDMAFCVLLHHFAQLFAILPDCWILGTQGSRNWQGGGHHADVIWHMTMGARHHTSSQLAGTLAKTPQPCTLSLKTLLPRALGRPNRKSICVKLHRKFFLVSTSCPRSGHHSICESPPWPVPNASPELLPSPITRNCWRTRVVEGEWCS